MHLLIKIYFTNGTRARPAAYAAHRNTRSPPGARAPATHSHSANHTRTAAPIAATQAHRQFTLNGDTTVAFVALTPLPVDAGGVQRYTTMLASL